MPTAARVCRLLPPRRRRNRQAHQHLVVGDPRRNGGGRSRHSGRHPRRGRPRDRGHLIAPRNLRSRNAGLSQRHRRVARRPARSTGTGTPSRRAIYSGTHRGRVPQDWSVACAGEGTTPARDRAMLVSGASERLPARLRCPAPSTGRLRTPPDHTSCIGTTYAGRRGRTDGGRDASLSQSPEAVAQIPATVRRLDAPRPVCLTPEPKAVTARDPQGSRAEVRGSSLPRGRGRVGQGAAASSTSVWQRRSPGRPRTRRGRGRTRWPLPDIRDKVEVQPRAAVASDAGKELQPAFLGRRTGSRGPGLVGAVRRTRRGRR